MCKSEQVGGFSLTMAIMHQYVILVGCNGKWNYLSALQEKKYQIIIPVNDKSRDEYPFRCVCIKPDWLFYLFCYVWIELRCAWSIWGAHLADILNHLLTTRSSSQVKLQGATEKLQQDLKADLGDGGIVSALAKLITNESVYTSIQSANIQAT